ncbi:MAG: 3-oxoacyl-ACP synthase III family protein [Chloroflexota bacterium]|nr:3-oxoacyl-ACP synthase III family protein [Chloroflexota bacterium]
MANVEIVGTGSYLPGEPITNEELASVFGREVIWLSEMLGANTRHFAIDLASLELRPGETNASMSTRAARQAILDADIDPLSIDLIVMATSTPDYPFPATALFVQEQLGIPNCCVIELRAGCGGMAQAFLIATHLIASGASKKALLIGSDMISPFISLFSKKTGDVDKELLVSLGMFGDGAGAIILSPGTGNGGVLDCMSRSISTGRSAAMLLRTGGALSPVGAPSVDERSEKVFYHDFQAIMRHGPELIQAATQWVSEEKGLDLSEVDFIIPPQVNNRLIDLTSTAMGVPATKIVSDFARVGNTVSASIYITLDKLNREGALRPGQLLVLLPTEATKWIYGAVVIGWTKQARQ